MVMRSEKSAAERSGEAKPAKLSARKAPPRVEIEGISPELESGRFPVKRVSGDLVEVGADVFKDGHDLLAARVRYRGPGDRTWSFAPMTYEYDSDRWTGSFVVDRIGRWVFSVEAWMDEFATWKDGFRKKLDAGQDVTTELLEGSRMAAAAEHRARGAERVRLRELAERIADGGVPFSERVRTALDSELESLIEQYADLSGATRYDRELGITVDRERARFAAWYEMFPRSQAGVPGRHGTFADAARRLPDLAALGFDVVYLPPIHPIGRTFRKGKNNTLDPTADDVGSPWAIGSEEGGHTAVHPDLGTIDDFDRFVEAAAEHDIDVALDYALQCSPDHPWVKEHPEWFFVRPDGTIKYAENPPKRYQDIYPLNFWCDDWPRLWAACRDVLLFWVEHGVRTFRVDNPHTKPLSFWEWVIREVQADHPDVIFLAEAFTRPKRMKRLAKLGFTQSYTYFTWRNGASEIREYLTELTQTDMRDYFRGNFFVNTPDILHEYLQRGGRPAFRIRLLLGATLSSVYGIYSGFELCENVPLRAGSEEYLDSEKYEIRVRDWGAPGNLNADLAKINRVRRENRALQLYANLTFHHSENEQILFYRKAAPGNDLLIVVNLNPFAAEATMVHVPLDELGIDREQAYVVEDLLTGTRYTWRGVRNYVRLDPVAEQAAHVLRLVRE
ncbi:MAG: hypothetical protein QOD06_2244 [Candidatus Binatota bacterium]|nr:hypothetical protein [Candidatus Binatota bacterium]